MYYYLNVSTLFLLIFMLYITGKKNYGAEKLGGSQ